MADVCEILGRDALKGVSFEHLESLLSFVVCVFVNVHVYMYIYVHYDL